MTKGTIYHTKQLKCRRLLLIRYISQRRQKWCEVIAYVVNAIIEQSLKQLKTKTCQNASTHFIVLNEYQKQMYDNYYPLSVNETLYY